MKNFKRRAFTLIELLTVIALLGILAAILIPVVNGVREKADIVASKSNLAAYVNAINMFKGEYNYFPFGDELDANERLDLSDPNTVTLFTETLSARDAETYEKTSAGGNRLQIEFYGFTEDDYLNGDSSSGQIADRFDNTNIFILIDKDGNGLIEGVPEPDNPSATKNIQTKVSAYVEGSGKKPQYYLYN
ncbi:MAG: type II secretion system protein [Opitutales bacterium]